MNACMDVSVYVQDVTIGHTFFCQPRLHLLIAYYYLYISLTLIVVLNYEKVTRMIRLIIVMMCGISTEP